MSDDPKTLLAEADALEQEAAALRDEADDHRHKARRADLIEHGVLETFTPIDWGGHEEDADRCERDAADKERAAADKRREAQDLSARLDAQADDLLRQAAAPDLEGTDQATELTQTADELRRRAAGL